MLLIGPPGVGKTHLAVGLARAAAHAGYRTYFTTAADLAARCHRAAIEGRWATTMRFYAGPTLLVIDELGYLPLPAEAASALFQVVSQRYLKTSHRHHHQPRRRRLGRDPRRQHRRRRHARPAPAPLRRAQPRRRRPTDSATTTPAADTTPPNHHRHPPTTTLTTPHRWGISMSTPGEFRWPSDKYMRVGHERLGLAIRTLCGDEAFAEYVRRLVFCIGIGNEDAHLKNWSLLYPDGVTPVLSPAYDLVSTIQYDDLDRGLALRLNDRRNATH